MTLWQGLKLAVRTGSVEDLVASKLIRYDEIDRADIQFLFAQFHFSWEAVRNSAGRLPHPFRTDTLVAENLANLKSDLRMWGEGA